MTKEIVMSGMRPTGKLHLGHYMGVIKNWIALQDNYECYFAVADWHAMTTRHNQQEMYYLKYHITGVVMDWLACGVDPDKSTLYVQSLLPETAELHLLLSMITPHNWVERDPTLKDMAKEDTGKIRHGLLGYPILQTADIIQFDASLVPVGKDQIAHLEISRDIVRKFYNLYGGSIKEPQPLLTNVPLLKGIDGQKMGKSAGNDIKISDTEEETVNKIMKSKTSAGTPDNCEVINHYYETFTSDEMQKEQRHNCENSCWGCGVCKKNIAYIINDKFRSIREKREYLMSNNHIVHKVMREGSERAREKSSCVISGIKNRMSMNYDY